MKNKIEYNIPFSEYRAIDAVNASSFSAIDPERDGCPAIWNAQHNAPIEIEDSPALSFGRAFHKYVLEFETFDREFVTLTDEKKEELFNKALALGSKAKGFSKSLTTYKDWKAEMDEGDMEIIDPATIQTLGKMRDSVVNAMPPELIHDTEKKTEVSLCAELHDHSGNPVFCKGRLDLVKPFSHIVDLKTVASASPTALGRFIAKYKLYVQAAFYVDLMSANGYKDMEFAWCFVDKRAPYPVVYYPVCDDLLKLGRQEYRGYLGWIHTCRNSNHWPGHLPIVEFADWFNTLLEEI